MSLTGFEGSNMDMGIIMVTLICFSVIGVGLYLFMKKKKKIGQTSKQLIERIPVKIIKKRGNNMHIEKATGTLKPIEKDSEGKALVIDKNRRLDNFDYTKLNSEGQLFLIEKGDGQLAYADFDKDRITSTGEGLLRDGFYLNQSFIDATFPLKENKWKVWLPVIVVIFSLVTVVVSLGLTYKYMTSLTEARQESEKVFAETMENSMATMEKIVRTLEISVQTQEEIGNHFKQIVTDLRQLKSD